MSLGLKRFLSQLLTFFFEFWTKTAHKCMKYENSFFEIKCILYKVPSGDERLFLFENYGHWSWLPYQESLDTYNSLANYNKSTLYSIVCTHSICLYLPILDLFKAKQALSSDHHPPQPKKLPPPLIWDMLPIRLIFLHPSLLPHMFISIISPV